MGSKDAPQKMQFLGAAKKKWQVWVLLYKTHSGGKTAQIRPCVCCFVLSNRYWGIVMYGPVTEPKQVRILMFLHIPSAHEQGQICICGFMSKLFLKQVPAFLKSHLCRKKPENNCFRVAIHFANNRFAFETFPPPPPLLHPNKREFAD